jgi:ribonuclease D
MALLLLSIVKSVLNIALDKTLQCSNWGGTLSPEQKQYAAIYAAAVALEVGEK